MKNLLIKTTAELSAGDEIYTPVKRFNVNERINHRAERPQYHILNFYMPGKIKTQEQRQDDYIVRCLENGIRPFNYPDHLWEEYLRDCAHEEHTNKCETKNAWRYVN